MNWDSLIAAGIIIALALGFWAKISRQTVPELIGSLIDRMKGTTEDTIDYATEVVSYE